MIAIASDHGGYDLKERVKKYLEEKNIPYQDMGCDSKASCDYPVFGHAAARAVADGTCEKGIVICTTGIGISISALHRHEQQRNTLITNTKHRRTTICQK